MFVPALLTSVKGDKLGDEESLLKLAVSLNQLSSFQIS